MVYEETQKMADGVEEEFTTLDHVDKTRYLVLEQSTAEREFELTKTLLGSSVPGIQEFITKERYLQLLGRFMYNSYAITTRRSSDSPLSGVMLMQKSVYSHPLLTQAHVICLPTDAGGDCS
jgi:import receptor subunit TOM20